MDAVEVTNPFEGLTYAQAIDRIAAQFGDRNALVFGDRRFSFSDVKAEAEKASHRLASLGLKRGETIAIWMPNRPEFLWYWLGAARMGLIAVFMNTRLKHNEFMYQLGQSESRALITAGPGSFRDFLGDLGEGCPELAVQEPGKLQLAALPHLRTVICLDRPDGRWRGVTDWSGADRSSVPLPEPETDCDRPAVIAYSSGTTALPKGAMLTHCIWRKAWDGGRLFELTPDDRLFLSVPLFGVLGFLSGMAMFWSHGCGVILEERFNVNRCMRLLQEEKCSCIHMLPIMIDELLAHPDFGKADLSRLRAGVVLSNDPAVIRRAVEKLGVTGAGSGYGMTESTGLVTRAKMSLPIDERLKSHGSPLPGCSIKVVDPDTCGELPAGEVGEIWIGGYSVMAGYFNKPEETARTITEDGWLRTGDAGIMNADGTLSFLRRLKDGYKHKGFNVSTPEVEAAILEHPSVEGAAVIGISHDRYGEIGVAFVVAKQGATVVEDELLSFLKERLASFKVPAHVVAVSEFPRTGGTEKIQKFKLKDKALELFGRAASV